MRAFYADNFVLPLPEGHRFPMAKYAMLRDAVRASVPSVVFEQAPAATDGELALVHTPAYIQAVTQGTLSPSQQREIGFPWSPGMAERARRSVGASVAAARVAMTQGIAANLAGGTHHAYADKGGGFCVFNDFCVAARVLQAEWARSKPRGAPGMGVAIIDLDVHQGNGTAHVLRNDASIFTLSMHGDKNFPFRKEPSDLDVPLPDGCDDHAYLQALELALRQLENRFAPDLVLYLAGADIHEGDRLGRLNVTDEGVRARDHVVMSWAKARGLPMAFAMGGGYGHDIATTVRVQTQTYQLAAQLATNWVVCP
jgi:acetoin utilization deacetylase AcuC-like enzyme